MSYSSKFKRIATIKDLAVFGTKKGTKPIEMDVYDVNGVKIGKYKDNNRNSIVPKKVSKDVIGHHNTDKSLWRSYHVSKR